MVLAVCYVPAYTALYACAEFLSDMSDRLSNHGIIMPNISYHSLCRRFFHLYIQSLSIGLYIEHNVSVFYIQTICDSTVDT